MVLLLSEALGLLYTGHFRPLRTEGTKTSPRKERAVSVPRRKIPNGDGFLLYTASPRPHRRVVPIGDLSRTVPYGTVPTLYLVLTVYCVFRIVGQLDIIGR